MSYADDLLDQTPAPQREGFTTYKHWKVVQTGPSGGTTNWFLSRPEASRFAADLFDVRIEGVSCYDYDSAWPRDWCRPHTHGASPDGERQRATEPDTVRSDARRSLELGRLV